MQDLISPPVSYPFQPGEAVFYTPHPQSFTAHVAPVPALIWKRPAPGPFGFKDAPRVRILRADGRFASVRGDALVYQGYCAVCQVPAIVSRADTALICPSCTVPVITAPPPADLVLRWMPVGHAHSARCITHALAQGCTWGDALRAVNQQHYDAFDAMLDTHCMRGEMYQRRGPWTEANGQYYWFSARMQWYADLGDEAGFVAYYKQHADATPAERIDALRALLEDMRHGGDGPGRPSQRLQLPPLDLIRPASDSQPDGADDLTRWLDRQFRKAA